MSALITAADGGDWGLGDQALAYLLTEHLGVKDLEGYVPSNEEEADDLVFLFTETGLIAAPEGSLARHIHERIMAHMRGRDDEVTDAFNEILGL